MTGPPEMRPQSEDCLALSVVAPPAPGPHPVIVFVHGGAFRWVHPEAPLLPRWDDILPMADAVARTRWKPGYGDPSIGTATDELAG